MSTKRMSKDLFLRKRDEINKRFERGTTRVEARRDQRIADLYCESGWTQREIAEVEGITQQMVSYLLCFGRFLDHLTTTGCTAIPKNLTERMFRGWWEKTPTGTGDTPRFKACAQAMNEDVAILSEKTIRRADVLRLFGDWKWRTLEEMRAELSKDIGIEIDAAQLGNRISHMKTGQIKFVLVESRPAGDGMQYRLKSAKGTRKDGVPADDLAKFLAQLKPMVAEGLTYSKRHAARCDPMHLHSIFFEIKNRMDQLDAILAGKQERFLPEPIKVMGL